MPRMSPAMAVTALRLSALSAAATHGQISMPITPRPRGRPKGTGINDRDLLTTVARLLAADRQLKPTTAIHNAGITDPSVVRRLRDKLKTTPMVAAFPVKRKGRGRRQSVVTPGRSPREVLETEADAPISPPDQPRQKQEQRDPASPSPDVADSGEKRPGRDPQLEALHLASEAATAMSRLYLHCMNYSAMTNPFSLALRSQSMMSQWMSGIFAAQLQVLQTPDKDKN